MGATRPRLLTAEDFWLLPGDPQRWTLIKGEVVEALPPGGLQGIVAAAVSAVLRAWARNGPGGVVGVESGFILRRNPDTVRGPDVFYVRPEHVPSTGIPEPFWEIPPDLAVEVVSPGEGAEEVREKVRDYLDAGTPLVWVVYPRTREVVVHTSDGLAQTYSVGDTLEGFDALPGFECAVAELFG